MGRASLWLRWSWRDLRGRWIQVVAIALVIAIGTGLYTGLGSLETWRVKSNDASFALLRAHDVEVQLAEGSEVPSGRLAKLVAAIPSRDDVLEASERLIVPTQVAIERPDSAPLLTPGQLVGSALEADGPPIDGVSRETGRALEPGDSGRPVVVLESNFADYNELPAAGALRIAGGRPLDWVGQGRSPEYFLVTKPGGGDFGGAESNFAVLFTSLETAQRAAGDHPVVNDLVLRLDPDADEAGIREELEAAVADAGLAGDVSTLADETAHRVLYRDAEGDQKLMSVFAILILAGAAFAAFNLASRIVEAQRREIGIGMALGVPPRELAIRPLLLGAQIALAGMVFGVAIGLLAGDLLRGVLEDLLPLPVMRTPFEPGVFVRGALLGLLIPFLATAVPVWRGLRMTPIEAIRVGFRSAKSSGVARIGRHLRLPGSSIGQMPLRNVLRTPRRTLLTVLGMGAVVTVLIAFLGFIDSFLATVDRSEAETARGAPDRITVALDEIRQADSEAVRKIVTSPEVASAQPRLQLPAHVSGPTAGFDVGMGFTDPGEDLWSPTIVEGELPTPSRPGVAISEGAAEDLGVAIGDEIRIEHPRRLPSGMLAESRDEFSVVGLHPNPFRNFVYADRSQAGAFGLAGAVNGLDIVPADGSSVADVERALFGLRGVASVEEATATIDFVRERLDDFVGILRVTELFALALALLIAFNATSIGVDERARENATMFAFGVPVRRALWIAVGESLATGLAGTLVGVAGGLAVIGWVTRSTLPETLPDLDLVVSVSAGTVAVAVAVGVLAVTIAPLLMTRRLARMDVPSTLRVVE